MASSIQQFLKEHGISEVEAIIPDMAGVARGKLMVAQRVPIVRIVRILVGFHSKQEMRRYKHGRDGNLHRRELTKLHLEGENDRESRLDQRC